MTAEENLKRLGIVLPPPPQAVGKYVPWIRTGSLVMTSGQLPWEGSVMKYAGRLGRDLSTEEGYQAARLAAINASPNSKTPRETSRRLQTWFGSKATCSATRVSPSIPRFSTVHPTFSSRSSRNAANIRAPRSASATCAERGRAVKRLCRSTGLVLPADVFLASDLCIRARERSRMRPGAGQARQVVNVVRKEAALSVGVADNAARQQRRHYRQGMSVRLRLL